MRRFSTKVLKTHTDSVQLRGTHIRCKNPDMPTVIAFPDLLDKPESLRPLFNRTFQEYRNLWLLSYRNSWNSDRNDSMSAEELANDVIRFMDHHKITTASLLGHGFGAKVAVVTGILKYHRINSVVSLDYAPLDYTKHAAWLELKKAIEVAAMVDLTSKTKGEIVATLANAVPNKRLLAALISNLDGDEKTGFSWRSGIKELASNFNLKDHRDNIGKFPLIGLYPGRALFLFAERGNWVHQSSNTIPIYNLFPQLLNKYGKFVDHVDTDNHWLHETEHANSLSRRIAEFYKWFDGVHPLLRDRSEIGKVSIPIRGRSDLTAEEEKWLDEAGDPTRPKMVPIHRHHNWAYASPADKVSIP